MKIVLLGSGNVATHLGKALFKAGHTILQVWSRSLQSASKLSFILEAEAITELHLLSQDADAYIISVPDDAIPLVAAAFPYLDKLLVHTSGTTAIDVLKNVVANPGVFYPLQTFSKQRELDFTIIPIAIEASNAETEHKLRELAESISRLVVVFDSEKRQALHVAAVFACNFSNHLYTIAEGILKEHGLDFNLIRPLVAETASKIQSFLPYEVQTGPAIRNDRKTLYKHSNFLENKPELKDLYEMMSQSIIKFYQKD